MFHEELVYLFASRAEILTFENGPEIVYDLKVHLTCQGVLDQPGRFLITRINNR